MNIVRMVACGVVLLACMIWLSSKVEAVPSGQLCQATANSLWIQWGKGELPNTDETINTMMKFKEDCPQQSGSMQKIADAIKGHQENLAGAKNITDTVNKHFDNFRSQSRAYDPGPLPGRTGPSNN